MPDLPNKWFTVIVTVNQSPAPSWRATVTMCEEELARLETELAEYKEKSLVSPAAVLSTRGFYRAGHDVKRFSFELPFEGLSIEASPLPDFTPPPHYDLFWQPLP